MTVKQFANPARKTKARGLWLGALLGLLASGPALALEPFTVDYEASYMGLSANGQMQLKSLGDNRWRYTLNVKNALANLSQATTFETHDGHWRPLKGSDSSQVLMKDSTKKAQYDWSAGVARWSGDVDANRAGPVKLQSGDLDALMINLALVRDLAAGKPLQYRMVDNGRAKQLDYSIAGSEQINIGGKTVEATKVVNTDGDKQTIAWLVPDMPVPVRILQREDGHDGLELQVRSLH